MLLELSIQGGWRGGGACTTYEGLTILTQNFNRKNLKGKDTLGLLDIEGTIILKWDLKIREAQRRLIQR
jgi:hypothetical protein